MSDHIHQAGGSNVGRLFAAQAQRRPDSVALTCDGESLSYSQLNARVNRLANARLTRGMGHGDRVGLLAHNCARFIEVELAAAKIGAITASLNWRLAPVELRHCIELTDPKLIIAQADYQDRLGETARNCLMFGADYEAALAAAATSEPAADAGGEDGLVIIFTSGTTGLPKGALISHRAMIARGMIYGAETGAPAKDTFVAWTPLFHMGANDFALATLLRGGKVIVVDGYQPEVLAAAIEAEKIHYLPLIPGMIMEFITVLRERGVRPKGIGMIGAMADLVPRQNEFCEIRLVDPDANDVRNGEPGELASRGPSLFSGYWRNEDANAESFRGGWFHMGDVFRRNPDGTLDFVDRIKYMIKSGGENIYPTEIEQYILADPRVSEAAVVRKPDERWGEVPVVFAARRDNGLSAEDLIMACKGKLASYKLPKEVYFIELNDFPRSTSGKIQRHELEARLRR